MMRYGHSEKGLNKQVNKRTHNTLGTRLPTQLLIGEGRADCFFPFEQYKAMLGILSLALLKVGQGGMTFFS